MAADVTAFVPRLVVEWVADAPSATHRRLPGTLVFTDLSGFTAMSEKLAALGKVGAEELTDHLDTTFTELLTVAGNYGGSLLKFGGDALLLFFWGDRHEPRATRAAIEMQETLGRIGLIDTSAGEARLQMTVGAHSGEIDFFLVGSSHRELFVCGEGANETVRTESGADPGEVRVSGSLAERLDPGLLNGTRLIAPPDIGEVPIELPHWPDGWSAETFVPALLNEHLKSGVELTEHRQMVVGFVHLANLDELLTDIGAQDTATHLNGLVSHVQDAFAAHDVAFVSTDIYERGPKIICATGAVRSFENDDERLLRALRDIIDYPSAIELRVGVNRGHGFCGYVGPTFRRTFVTIGDVVNTAARVMAKAGPGELLSTAAPLERSETIFDKVELQPFEAKGKAEPLIAYRLGAITGTRHTSSDSPTLALVGRDAEVVRLQSLLDSLREGKGSLIEFVGEPGIGKSRLAEELLAMAEDIQATEQRCGRYAASTPYFPFRTLLARLVGGRTVGALTACVQRRAPKLKPDLPLLAIPLGLDVALTADLEKLGPSERKARMFSAIAQLVEATMSAPTIWLVEDAHWIDSASADLLRHLTANLGSVPLMICLTRRPGEASFDAGATMELGPLDDAASAALLDRAASTTLMQSEMRRLVERAHGNPHFLIQLAAAVSERRDIDHLPDSLEALLAARIDDLPPVDRRVLRHLAVVGNRFDPKVAREAVEDLPPPGDDRWRQLSEFVVHSGSEWRFIHTLVRDTAYEGLSFRERRAVHGRTGAAIESFADDPLLVCELLSLHFHNAEAYDRSLTYSLTAAEKARSAYAPFEAATFFERSVEAARALDDEPSLGDALTGLAHSEVDQGHFVQARDRYSESLDIKRRLDNRQGVAAQLNGLGLVARLMGEYDEAYRLFQECLEILRSLEAPEGVDAALNSLGTVAWYRGAYDEAKRWFEEALAVAQAENNSASIASSLDTLGTVAFALGDLKTARSRYEEGLAINQRAADKPGIAASYANLGNVAWQEGHAPQARTAWEESLALKREIGDRKGVAAVLSNLGTAAYHEGDLDEAKRCYEESLVVTRELGDRTTASQCLHNLAAVEHVRGRLVEARDLCLEALEIRREIGDRRGVAESLTELGTIATADRDPDSARSYFAESVGLLNELGNKSGLAECLEGVAALCAMLGDATPAARLLGAVDTILASTGLARTWSAAARESTESALRDTLGEQTYASTIGKGQQMSLEDAVALAENVLAQPATTEVSA